MTEHGVKEKNAKAHKPYNRRLPTAPLTGRRSYLFRLLYVPSIKDTDVIQYLLSLRANGENITQFITDAIREKMEKTK